MESLTTPGATPCSTSASVAWLPPQPHLCPDRSLHSARPVPWLLLNTPSCCRAFALVIPLPKTLPVLESPMTHACYLPHSGICSEVTSTEAFPSIPSTSSLLHLEPLALLSISQRHIGLPDMLLKSHLLVGCLLPQNMSSLKVGPLLLLRPQQPAQEWLDKDMWSKRATLVRKELRTL